MQAAVRLLDRHWRDVAEQPALIDLARARAMEQILVQLAATVGRVAARFERSVVGER
jgi:hypothetical protein